ncbi:hydroxymethylglutaryl-CoA lyase [Salicibibacter cibi]|uniref:Hydroxymethylglutaryl-CoA lyase n=1 Tax=Salicibibacter cibi TaxID=2743001 RepID=A0A7T6Z877_9BACI|nr:hydroxymethylglutaryl-CoA lyase [Salicibibacter cibi]QQK78654.1 hydroxymethylglutaryl-CoA lyase [Salicibibacter cibi]
MNWNFSDFVEIQDVCPRDGLQMETNIISTDKKVELINALSNTGISAIQVTSTVHPKAVPQLSDAEEVMEKINRKPGVSYSVLVPNERGAERAIPMKADEWELMLSVTESHSLSNANKTVDEGIKEHERVARLAKKNGDIKIRGAMATAFGCPFEGKVPFENILYVAQAYYSMGIRSMAVADTIGTADPKLVYTVMEKLKNHFPDVAFSLHLHNTRGLAIANILAGIDAGVRSFDAALGGIGGCPFAPGATGNVATEDVVHMLDLMGINNGIHLRDLLETANELKQTVDHDLDSAVYRAGPSHSRLSTLK